MDKSFSIILYIALALLALIILFSIVFWCLESRIFYGPRKDTTTARPKDGDKVTYFLDDDNITVTI